MKTQRSQRMKYHRLLFCLGPVLLIACGANDNILKSGKEPPAQANVESTRTPFEKDLADMRAADFLFVFVIRREDGGTIDAEDRSVIRLQTADANRRVATDNDRAIIIGTNYRLPAKSMSVLFDRFAVENYSPPPGVMANANSNPNK